MLYSIQVLSVTYRCARKPGAANEAEEDDSNKGKKIYLDISSDEQIARRYFLGRFSSPKTKICQSIVHITSTPVTLHLSQGATHAHLGVQTLFEFLNYNNLEKKEQLLTFSFRGRSPVYQLKLSISTVQWNYAFSLNDITCARQASSWPRRDRPFAEVEFNHSPQSVISGCTNRYNLGTFLSHDAAAMFIVNNMSFSSITNFAIDFYIKKLFMTHKIGSFHVIPAVQYLYNTLGNDQVPLISSPDEGEEVLHRESDFMKELAGAGSEALVLINHATGERSVILSGTEEVTTKRMMLSSEEATYEVHFTISRTKLKQIVKLLPGLSPKSPFSGPISSRGLDSAMSLGKQKGPIGSSWHFIQEVNKPRDLNLEPDPDALSFVEEKEADDTINSTNFGELTTNNVEILIDGLDTFKRYYDAMMGAHHSISILAWEISLSFGLVLVQKTRGTLPTLAPSSGWITLEDVLLSKALAGVRVRIVVWRHELVSYLNRLMYLGEVTIEREVSKLQNRCQKLGLVIRVFHTIKQMPDISSSYADPFVNSDAHIIVIIAGNPEGLVSSHHEKLVLIDAECTEHTVAFIGGFDIARGRYDQPLHQIPKPYIQLPKLTSGPEPERYSGREIQPLLRRIRFLWHDIQMMISGPAAQKLRLHFAQRWIHSFNRDRSKTRNFSFTIPKLQPCTKPHRPIISHRASACEIGLQRTWKGVFDVGFLFDDYCRMITNAKKYLYFEHQYPFQNGALTYYMCEALQQNPDLKVIIVTAVKTDLPSGIVGELFDWSQDHIIEHLHLIHSVAPDRVGIYGLVRQDDLSERVKPIYVHSKLSIVDDEFLVIGSTNMDNMSFFYSSELSATVISSDLAKETKVRLFQEHLGNFYRPEMKDDFSLAFDAFQRIATNNVQQMKDKACLIGRPVFMAPAEHYQLLMQNVYYPNKVTKLLYKMGVNTEDLFNQTMEFAAFLKNNANETAQKYAPKLLLKSKM
eukprot:TRINITY_DN4473_c1_g1_i1.p1 TRINITY_DN4473_c1_g1~~TRINITY_DN4473_c1_g1_i1.p1  ORF type:complete len:974 (+),score=221.89 TRINITY_DN4473_c1_g1_i1:104-3025(+)